MRLGNLGGRSALITSDGGAALDLAEASGGRLPSSPALALEQFAKVQEFAAGANLAAARPFRRGELGAPSPTPRQVFAIGLNYRDHATETSSTLPSDPLVFTKFASCLTGPDAEVPHPGGSLDWEVELVVVIGKSGRNISRMDAWSHVAGLCVGQDLSERELQHLGSPPQFSLGKSFFALGPTGPWLVTPDELANPEDLELGCALNGESVQKSRTSYMVFSVVDLITRLSEIVELFPGDVLFTGTPAGVGLGMRPPHFLSVGDEIVSYVAGIGELRNRIVAGARA